jgi:hypothetical protein
MLESYIADAEERSTAARNKLQRLRESRTDSQAAITRSMTLVETAVMRPDQPEVRDRMGELKLRRADLDRKIEDPSGQCRQASRRWDRKPCSTWPFRCAGGSARAGQTCGQRT